MFKIKKVINLIAFALFCGLVVVGVLFGEDFIKGFNKGEFDNFVIENKPTVYVIFDDKKIETNAYDKTNKMMGYIGREFQESISLRAISIHTEEVEVIKQKFNLTLETLPTVVILNKRGYIVGVYEGNLPSESIAFDLEQITK